MPAVPRTVRVCSTKGAEEERRRRGGGEEEKEEAALRQEGKTVGGKTVAVLKTEVTKTPFTVTIRNMRGNKLALLVQCLR